VLRDATVSLLYEFGLEPARAYAVSVPYLHSVARAGGAPHGAQCRNCGPAAGGGRAGCEVLSRQAPERAVLCEHLLPESLSSPGPSIGRCQRGGVGQRADLATGSEREPGRRECRTIPERSERTSSGSVGPPVACGQDRHMWPAEIRGTPDRAEPAFDSA